MNRILKKSGHGCFKVLLQHLGAWRSCNESSNHQTGESAGGPRKRGKKSSDNQLVVRFSADKPSPSLAVITNSLQDCKLILHTRCYPKGPEI